MWDGYYKRKGVGGSDGEEGECCVCRRPGERGPKRDSWKATSCSTMEQMSEGEMG